MLNNACKLACYLVTATICLSKLSLWTYCAVQYALIFAFVYNSAQNVIEVDPDLKHQALGLIGTVIAIDLFVFFYTNPWQSALTAVPLYFMWGILHVVSTGFGRLVWKSHRIGDSDRAKVKILSALMLSTVMPAFVYLSDRSPQPVTLGDFNSKPISYGALIVHVGLITAVYFSLERLNEGTRRDIATKMAI